jgi:prepilin peptidase CpaA
MEMRDGGACRAQMDRGRCRRDHPHESRRRSSHRSLRPATLRGRMLADFYPLGIIAIACAVLFYVAFADLQNYKIKNELVMLLAALYGAYVFATGTWSEALTHVMVAALIFVVMLVFYSYGLLGGGDVKLLTVAFLWVGKDCALLFAVVMLAITGVHAGLVYLRVLGAQMINGRRRIAYAPAIAGALVVVFGSGCLEHARAM